MQTQEIIKYNTITESDIACLCSLKVEKAQYYLNRELNLSYRSILRSIHKLNKMSLIKLSRIEHCVKGGKDKHYWIISERGLALLDLLKL